MSTIHELRLNLERAQAAYLSADIEHPTQLLVAKELLANARHDYWAACADLPQLLVELITVLEPAIGGIGNQAQCSRAQVAIAQAKKAIG